MLRSLEFIAERKADLGKSSTTDFPYAGGDLTYPKKEARRFICFI
jgi:hypothetical protein